MYRAVARSFERWIENQDEQLARQAMSTRAWLITSLFVLIAIPVLAHLPIAGAIFQFRVGAAILCYLPAGVVGFALASWLRTKESLSSKGWCAYLLASAALLFYFASLVSWTSADSAPLIASLFVLTAAYQGYVLRVTPSEPFLAIATSIVTVAAALIGGANHNVTFLAGAAAIAAEFLAGNSALHETVRSGDLRGHSLVADAVPDPMRSELDWLNDTLAKLLDQEHRLGKFIDGITLRTETVRGRAELVGSSIRQLLPEIEAGLVSLSFASAGLAQTGSSEPETVDILAIIEAEMVAIRSRFATVEIVLEVDRRVAESTTTLLGGAQSFRRVIENLLVNACECHGARNINFRVRREDSTGRVVVEVADDGLGDPEPDSESAEKLMTAWKKLAALRLFAAERLLRLSGGTMKTSTDPNGGETRVTLMLPSARLREESVNGTPR